MGVNSDGDRSVLKKIIEEQKLNYRSAVAGSTEGVIPKAWNVRGWPTVYLIDPKGIIVYKSMGVDPEILNKKIEEAVAKAGS